MTILVYIVVLLFSVIIHEVAHGYVAYIRGDDTAKRSGRITLNPIPHIDLFGSILLPASLAIMHAPVLFGWAKPVPVNFARLKNPRVDVPLVSVAGPLSNILLAVISAMLIRVINFFPGLYALEFAKSFEALLYMMVVVNIVLPIINLIPIPPLDGSKVVTYFMPRELAYKYLNINPYLCFVVLLILLWSGVIWKLIAPIINFCVAVLVGVPAA